MLWQQLALFAALGVFLAANHATVLGMATLVLLLRSGPVLEVP